MNEMDLLLLCPVAKNIRICGQEKNRKSHYNGNSLELVTFDLVCY